MTRTVGILMVTLLWIAGSGEMLAQRQLLSPRDSVFLTLDTNTISVNYGRPSMRGRTIMGGLVPWNEVWRTGANEATHLRTNFDMMFGSVPVMRGRYTLWTIPSPTGWTMIVNKQTGQWGTRYDEKQDLARFPATVEKLGTPVDTFTIALEQTGPTSGMLKLMWETTLVSVPFEKNDRIRPISPLDSTEISLAGRAVKIRYSRPYMRGRKIWDVVVPYDSLWRTGANASTRLITETDLVIGGTTIPKGTHTVYTLPTESGFQLIINRREENTPFPYDEGKDIARISMRMENSPTAIDPFRIWFDTGKKGTALLRLGWDDRVYTTEVFAKP